MAPTPMRCSVCKISLFKRMRAKLDDGSYICQHCAVSEVKRLRGQLRDANEALRAYNAVSICPGIFLEPGVTTGCAYFAATPHSIPDDCPTCAAVAAAEDK